MNKHLLKIAALTIPMLWSCSAVAEPVYLDCTFMIDGNPSVIKFTLDEQTGMVARYVVASGYSGTLRGTFTPDKVIFGDNDARFEIDRTSLTISRTIVLINSTNKGKCVVQTPPRRVF
ncbi:MAG: hypothetical protein QM651_01425 [Rhodoblastus sp.]